jgi:hypothetical protein
MRGLIAGIVIVAVIAGAAFMGKSGTTVVPPTKLDPATQPVENGPKMAVVMPVKIVIECEDTTTLNDKAPDGTVVMKIGKQSEGTEIKYIDIPDGWIDTCGFGKVKGDAGKLPGLASYEFEAPRDDTYYISLRAKWLDSCGNSVWAKVDESLYFNLEDQNGQISEKNFKWDWHQLYVGGKPKGFTLSKGKHILWVNTREDGPKLDQWVISTEATAPVGGAVKKPAN